MQMRRIIGTPIEAHHNPACAKRMTTKTAEEVNKLYRDGLIDREIAVIVGFSQQAICGWRRRHRNPPNGEAGRPCKKYKIILAATGEVAAHGTLKECMEQMGKTEVAVRSIVADCRRGRYNKWTVEVN